MRRADRAAAAGVVLGVALALPVPALAEADYAIADGSAELAVVIDPDEVMVWMNTFPVDPAGEYIDLIKVAYGRVGGPSALKGLAVRILLYEDATGGSPQDAMLRWSTSATISPGNVNTLATFRLPAMRIRGSLVAAVLYADTAFVFKAIGALDTTPPSLPDRSYVGFAQFLDPADLGAIPPAQWGTIESFGTVGNFRIEAHGRTVDDGALSLLVGRTDSLGLVHLSWTAAQATYVVERASRPDFSDGEVLATGIGANSHDDPTLNDGRTWFYRAR